MAGYSRLIRNDLTTFDGEATALVLEMSDAGWEGRITKAGHASMRAPDGETTYIVSRASDRGRSGANQRAFFERWKNTHLTPAEEKPAVSLTHTCIHCGKDFDTERGLAAHKRSHTLPDKQCPECGRMVKYLDSHRLRSHGVGGKADPIECLLAVLAENEHLKQENRELKALVALR